MVSDRLIHLQTEVEAYYEQLAGKEKARRLAPQEEKVRLQQQIRELQKELGSVERDYWLRWRAELEGLTIPEADADVAAGEILTEVESLELELKEEQEKKNRDVEDRKNREMMVLLQGIKAELTKPEIPGTGKLKAAIPLLPGFLSYELELDTEGLLRRSFPTFCRLANKLKK